MRRQTGLGMLHGRNGRPQGSSPLLQAGEDPPHSKAERAHMSAEQQQVLLQQAALVSKNSVPKQRQAPRQMSLQPSSELLQGAPSNASERLTEYSIKGQMGHAA